MYTSNPRSTTQYTKRYSEFARVHGHTPRAQGVHDFWAWPGGRNAGFILWNGRRVQAFLKARPEHRFAGSLKDDAAQRAYDAWLEQLPVGFDCEERSRMRPHHLPYFVEEPEVLLLRAPMLGEHSGLDVLSSGLHLPVSFLCGDCNAATREHDLGDCNTVVWTRAGGEVWPHAIYCRLCGRDLEVIVGR